MAHFKLISFKLCPFVQRSVITLKEKNVDFDIDFIDLSNKPDWFVELSPLGKVPVLVVDGKHVLYESAVINEYLDEVTEGRRLPSDPLERAFGRAWIEYISSLLVDIYKLQLAKTEDDARKAYDAVKTKLARLEQNVHGAFWFGDEPSLVDFAAAPAFMRLAWKAKLEPTLDFYAKTPKVKQWADALLAREAVQASVVDDVEALFHESLLKGESWVGRSLRT